MTVTGKHTKKKAQKHGNTGSQNIDRVTETDAGVIASFLKNQTIPILIFLFALFFILTFSNPALFMNDEWITVNQLHQLDEGSHLIVNEGKYGTFQNGTPGLYFQERHNLLGYSLLLPILSLPALKLFGLFGDQFRLLIVLLWSMLPVAMALLVEMTHPEWTHWKGIRWTWLAIGAGFVGFLANLLLYYPWPFTALDAPREVAAAVFTNHLIFAMLAVMIYLICRTVFEDTWFSIFGTIACISCSSYIFWAANAKDHILVVALVAAVILFMIRYIRYGGFRDAALGFAFIGLLAWGRAELGFTVFLFTLIFYGWSQYREIRGTGRSPSDVIPFIVAPACVALGALPSLLNNIYVTGSPLIPPHYVYMKMMWSKQSSATIGAESISDISQSVPAPTGGLGGFFGTVVSYFSPSVSTIPQDFFGILFAPASGNMSLIAVSPLIFFAIVILPIAYISHRDQFGEKEKSIIGLLIMVSIAIWLAYMQSWHGLNASQGVLPDIRYFAPFYLLAGLLGLLAVKSFLAGTSWRHISLYYVPSIAILTPAVLIIMLLIQPYGGYYAGYTAFFTQMTFSLLVISFIAVYLKHTKRISPQGLYASIILVLTVPLVWQMMMLFLYSVSKFNGYPLWVPIVDALYNSCIGVIEAPH
ncbi:hypothetical protein ABH15_10985 [Methanoculleus taiwanensis]|uniref:Glycosyltransferase RgtA/B/C/D-like domain-containing protein n=1 Tax=Methanoculleus taiwanensis TaxID=1550565 RepID=A0A498GYT4_9EURY|nr:hypothetical protein [Methanoculleus taiwanensis]RXE55294.1 hypothetical protein ABH15_10985 [Methanoculleus taiwanensis]